jgi:hypothetical protein
LIVTASSNHCEWTASGGILGIDAVAHIDLPAVGLFAMKSRAAISATLATAAASAHATPSKTYMASASAHSLLEDFRA